jgi:hypothetical protein
MSQKRGIFIVTAMRTSNLTFFPSGLEFCANCFCKQCPYENPARKNHVMRHGDYAGQNQPYSKCAGTQLDRIQ